jgi:hypothetical protein
MATNAHRPREGQGPGAAQTSGDIAEHSQIGAARQVSALPDLAQAIEREHQAAHQAARTALEHAVACGVLLIQAKAEVGHGGWLPWIEANLSFGARQSQKYARLAEHADDLDQMRIENSYLTIDQALAALADGKPPLRVHLTGAVEWYTPAPYLECARQVLGEFDTDPASSEIAQEQVRARSYFTREDDGLTQPWNGRVWCNPHCDADKFVDKLLEELSAGRTTEAVFLVNAYCDTRWFHRAAAACSAICFTLGRIRFEKPDGQAGQPPHGSALIYFGDQVDRFARHSPARA